LTKEIDTRLTIRDLLDRLPSGTQELRRHFDALLESYEATVGKFELVKQAVSQFPDEFYVKDASGRFVVINKASPLMRGLELEDFLGKSDLDLLPLPEATACQLEDARIMADGMSAWPALSAMTVVGGDRPKPTVTKYPVYNDSGDVIGISGYAHDSTRIRQTEIMLRSQAEILEKIVANRPLTELFAEIILLIQNQLPGISGSIVILNPEGRSIAQVVSPSIPVEYSDMLVGIEIGEGVGSCGTACYRRQPVYVEDIQKDALWRNFRELVAPFGYRSCWSTPFFKADGSVFGSFALYSSTPRKPDEFEGQLMRMGGHLAEVAIERDRSAEEIRMIAQRDGLTGLPNRNSFNSQFSVELCKANTNEQSVSLAFIDFDDFKLVNDRYGHGVGDEFLCAVSRRMTEAATQGEIIARLGGDEFVIVGVDVNVCEFERTIREIMQAVRQPVHIHGHTLRVSASVGIAGFPVHGRDTSTLLANADTAMYRAKKRGGNAIDVYNFEIQKDIQTRRLRAEELRVSIANGDIDCDFQPLYNLNHQRVFGFEALARWNHPELGRLYPGDFIALAEDTGLIIPLGLAVLKRACGEAQRWRTALGRDVTVSVNASALQFSGGVISEQVESALRESGLPARLLELELTESLLLEDEGLAIATISELKAMGISFAIDDFGTGFSNLSALARLPLDRLKIDRSIIQGIGTNPAAESITSAIIAMGQRLGMKVLAEGVETAGQLEFLTNNHCDSVQGYLIGRPSSSADAETMAAIAGGGEQSQSAATRR
jgi:diguanylate cyclase (GGDEF)-like protein